MDTDNDAVKGDIGGGEQVLGIGGKEGWGISVIMSTIKRRLKSQL